MIKAIVSDFSRVLLFPKDTGHEGGLNVLHKKLSQNSEYNPLDHFELNTELLDFYRSLKKNYPLYIFTTDSIQDAPEFQKYLQPVFEKIFSASKMNTSKKDPEAYRKIAANLHLNPETILYIDDSAENIEAATMAKFIAHLYKNNDTLFKEIRSKLSILTDLKDK